MTNDAAAVAQIESSFGWVGESLTSSDPAHIKRASKPLMSASTSARVRQCPAKHLAEANWPQPNDPIEPRNLGTGAHHVCEVLHGLPSAERTEEMALSLIDVEQADVRAKNPDMSDADMGYWRAYTTKSVLGAIHLEDPRDVDVYANEMSFRGTKLPNGVATVGFIDRVDRIAGSDSLAIVDYKFGQKAKKPNPIFGDDYGDQVRVYADCVEAETGQTVAKGTLRFGYVGTDLDVDLSPAARRKTRKAVALSREVLDEAVESRLFPARPSNLCAWCPIVNACPVANVVSDKAVKQAATQPALAFSHFEEPPLAPTHETEDPIQEDIMTTEIERGTPVPTDKPFFEFVGEALNVESYAAVAVTATYAFALDYVSRRADELSAPSVKAQLAAADSLARSLSTVMLRVGHRFAANVGWQSALNRAIRSFVYKSVELAPVPLGGGSAPDLEAYFMKIENVALRMLQRSLAIYDEVGEDYESLDGLV